MFSNLFGAVGFLTILPVRSRINEFTLVAFPLVGLLIGASVGYLLMLMGQVMHPLAASAIAVGVDGALTGLLHLDALADSADGLIPHLTPQRRLEVMQDPRTGAFGVAVIVIVELSRFAAMSTPFRPVIAIGVCYGFSRSLMALGILCTPSAKENSILVDLFGDITRRARNTIVLSVFAQLVILIGLGWLEVGTKALVGFAFGTIIFLLVLFRSKRAINGSTGDVIGAGGMVGEVAFLLSVFAA